MANITDERTSQSDIEQVKESVQDVAEQAKGATREQLRTQIDTRTTQVGEQVSSTARAFRNVEQQLRQEGNDRVASIIDGVAGHGERLGVYLSRTDGNALLRDAEDFARKQPWLVVGAGALAGFMASRFVKASSGNRYDARVSRSFAPDPYAPAGSRGGTGGLA